MKKLLIVSPHFSTGGAPAVTLNKVELLKDSFELMVVEYSFLSWQFVVQRERIQSIVGSNFKSLGDNKHELINIIEEFKPDVISMEEFPEMFMEYDLALKIYKQDRPYKIIETTHDSSFNPARKMMMPDKFVFVSAYNALRYSHLDVPHEIIEYPIDFKEQTKDESRSKLGLADDYKHVIIVGLFTPRKNQKYAFELAQQTKGYKIQYHFLGNQAENFASYWKPLMELKNELDNCIVWGERSDIDEFMNAADLFLFPSKGDRNNKELNPIVIKEAMKYPSLPKLMYNLDVYLDKYEASFLTGDIYEDAKVLIDITKPSKKEQSDPNEELIIIGTYPNLKSRVVLTKNTIQSLKPLGRKILLLSHYPVDEQIQSMVDFYIYDAHNPLCHHSYYNRFFRNTDEYQLELNINGLKDANQSLTVLTNMYNAAKFAKGLGYKSFFYSTYDVVVHEDDLNIIRNGFEKISESNAYLGSLNTPFGKGIQTNGMFFKTDFFIETFDDVRTAPEYNKACELAGCQNFLEDYMIKKLNGKPNVLLIHNEQETLLVKSGLGVASNSEYYSVLPIEGQKDEYIFYFYTYNIDEREIFVQIEEGLDTSEFSFFVNKNREVMKLIKFNGNEIIINIDFIDGSTCYKTDKICLNSDNINKYNNTGFFRWLKKEKVGNEQPKPKIKLVHIQTTINDEREERSRESLREVEKFGIEYILHKNEPYKDLPPKFNCLRPECVSEELFDEHTVHTKGTALTPAHYGCYEAFKNAILNEFEECDFLIVCEGDCLLEIPASEFCETVFKAARLCEENNIGFFSFGDTKTLEHGWVQSPVIKEIPNQDLIFITNHIIGIQSIMFPKSTKKWLKMNLRTHKWDAADIYFNTIFRQSPFEFGIVKKRLTTQADGYSLIDRTEKKFL